MPLSWNLPGGPPYIHMVFSKLSQKVRLLGRLRSSVPNEMLKNVYQKCTANNKLFIVLRPGVMHQIHSLVKFQVFKTVQLELFTGIRDWSKRGL